MKIALDGQIIDTEHIFKIGPIFFKPFIIRDDDQKSLHTEADLEETIHDLGSMSFEITLFNNQKITFTKVILQSSGDYFDEKTGYHTLKYNIKEGFYTESNRKAVQEFTEKRNQLIALWSENQSKIPQINFSQ